MLMQRAAASMFVTLPCYVLNPCWRAKPHTLKKQLLLLLQTFPTRTLHPRFLLVRRMQWC